MRSDLTAYVGPPVAVEQVTTVFWLCMWLQAYPACLHLYPASMQPLSLFCGSLLCSLRIGCCLSAVEVRDLSDWISTFSLVLERSPMSSSATAADKKRTQTPSSVGWWPDIPSRILQDAQQKVASRGCYSHVSQISDLKHFSRQNRL